MISHPKRLVMNRVSIDLENCYGIRKLSHTFDFSKYRSHSVYAPNGSMKSSFATVFDNIAEGVESKDAIFSDRVCKSDVKDENGEHLPRKSVLAVRPYGQTMGEDTKTATLLVDNALRKEYEELHKDVEAAREKLVSALKSQSSSKKHIETEIADTFVKDGDFNAALDRVSAELSKMTTTPFKDVKYDKIFDPKVLEVLSNQNVKLVIEDYVRKYDALLADSTYFRKGIFDYHHASTIAKSLADNGFFEAKHTVRLNAGEVLDITSKEQLETLIQEEKDGITQDPGLRKKFAELDKFLTKNIIVKEFRKYLDEFPSILPQLANIELFRDILWKNYLKANYDLYESYLQTLKATEARRIQIHKSAKAQRTQWEEVIEIFNDRFDVPFTLVAENRIQAVLGEELLVLGFVFNDRGEMASLQRAELLKVLSTGEAKAFYVLNLIFEIQVRKKAGIETLLVIDDIADSFDYKNKYAIIEYLKEVGDDPLFKQIILTHNFDFFRTLEARHVVHYTKCHMALKNENSVSLIEAKGFKNVFIRDWKSKFFEDPKKRIASIAFIRNMIEYLRDVNDSDFLKLTSLLHFKSDSADVTQADLDAIFIRMFGGNQTFGQPAQKVVGWIHAEAAICLNAPEGINLEHKIVLSIAIRLAAEQYMIEKINDPAFVDKIPSNQTTSLLKRFIADFPKNDYAKRLLGKVVLITSENIHLNSFMYEPILDMSDAQLRRLYSDVLALLGEKSSA
jgi:hypothetical protein